MDQQYGNSGQGTIEESIIAGYMRSLLDFDPSALAAEAAGIDGGGQASNDALLWQIVSAHLDGTWTEAESLYRTQLEDVLAAAAAAAAALLLIQAGNVKPDAAGRALIGIELKRWTSEAVREHLNQLRITLTGEISSKIRQLLQKYASTEDIARMIRDLISGFSEIVQKRVDDLFHEAQMIGKEAAAASSDLAFKSWRNSGSPNTCRACLENAAVGPIPVQATFPSGHRVPPAHPSCRCAVVYTRR